MSAEVLLILLSAFVVYSLLSKWVDRILLTLPIIFMVLGYFLTGPLHASSNPAVIHEGKRLLAEITLVLILFTDASHVRFQQLRKSWQIPTRMLVIGMPLSIALGTVAAYMVSPASGFALALLTAAVLTPTDAALGQAVVSSHDVPKHLSQTINVESGLNDGLALPFVLLGAILASTGAAGDHGTDGLAMSVLLQLTLGPIAGIGIGWFLAKAMDWSESRNAMGEPAAGVVFISSAFIAFVLAEHIGGNGFIAAFVAGMVFGNTFQHDIHFISEFMEGAGQLLTMSSFFIFGAFLLPEGIQHMSWKLVLLGLSFLTVIRISAIYLSLWGTGLPVREKLFLGWFGPRGLASILFTLIIMDEFDIPHEEELLACVSMTVMFSIFLHGFSSMPLTKLIAKKAKPSVD